MRTQQRKSGRLVKRYGNRKLYDVERSRYITLDGIRSLVQQGKDVRVVDNDTGEDLTGVTFAQIIYEAEKRENGVLSLPVLRRLVQFGDDTVRDLRRSVERGREAFESMRERAEQQVHKLVDPPKGGRRNLIGDLLDAPQRHLDDLQQRIDAQVRQSVERMASNPTLRVELKRVEQTLRQLEKRLGKLARSARATPAPKRSTRRARK